VAGSEGILAHIKRVSSCGDYEWQTLGRVWVDI
jgi:hypothetical protein